MGKIICKILSVVIVLAVILLALVEVYPAEMRKAEAKVGISVVDPIQDMMKGLKQEIQTATHKDYQKDIEDRVNKEMVK